MVSVEELENRFKDLHGVRLTPVREKLQSVFAKNHDFQELRIVKRILEGEASTVELKNPENLTVTEIACLKFSPVVSCEMERVFSKYKVILRDNRESFEQ